MTHREEDFVLDSIENIIKTIRGPDFKRLIKETHENNIMLRQIIQYLNNETMYSNTENMEDFGRNIMANLISNRFNKQI